MLVDLSKHVKLIRPEGKSIFPYSNSLYIDDKVKIIIDAGAGRAYGEIDVNNVNLLLFSHYHFDHIHGSDYFTNARIMAGKEELWAYTDREKYNLAYGHHLWRELMGEEKDDSWAQQTLPDDVLIKPGFRHVNLAGVFKDGDIFETGGTSFTAIHIPGHSPGHYAFYFPNEKILFSADLDISPRGPWYGNELSNFDDLVKSVHRLIDLEPEILVTSHRKVFYSDIKESLLNYLDIALSREEMIYDYLSIPRQFSEIVNRNFNFATWGANFNIVFWNKIMILKHLERLKQLGRIYQRPDNKYEQTQISHL